MSEERARRDLSLKSRVAIAAAVCLLLPISMWIVLFLSNRSVEERLTKSQRDLARVSGLRGLISLTEKVTTPVLNAADYGSDIEDREAEYKDAAAGASAGLAKLEGLFTSQEATVFRPSSFVCLIRPFIVFLRFLFFSAAPLGGPRRCRLVCNRRARLS